MDEKNILIEVAILANTNNLEQTDISQVLDALADAKRFGLGVDSVGYNPKLFCIGKDPFGVEVLGTKFDFLPEWWFPIGYKMKES